MPYHDVDIFNLTNYAVNNCTEAERSRIEQHLRNCSQCRSKLQQLQDQQIRFLQKHPFEKVSPVEPKGPGKQYFLRRPIHTLAAMIILFFATGLFIYLHEKPAPSTRIKGTTALTLYAKTAEGKIETRTDHHYQPGENVQFAYSCAQNNWFILLSIDQSGTITRFYPTQSDSSVQLPRGQLIPLPNSIILDNYLGKELFVAVFSEHPLNAAAIEDKLLTTFKQSQSIEALPFQAPHSIVQTIMITKQKP